METPAQASRATGARHTTRTHRVVNDVEVGGAWRLRHPLVVSLFFPGIAVLLVLALLPLYEMVLHRRFLRHIHTLYLLHDD